MGLLAHHRGHLKGAILSKCVHPILIHEELKEKCLIVMKYSWDEEYSGKNYSYRIEKKVDGKVDVVDEKVEEKIDARYCQAKDNATKPN